MHTSQTAAVTQPAADSRDRQGRSVGRQNRIGGQQRFQIREQCLLDCQILDDCLDHQMRTGQIGNLLHRLQPRQMLAARRFGQLTLGDRTGQTLGNSGNRLRRSAGTGIVQPHMMPRLRRDLGNPRPHGPGADHGDHGGQRQGGHVGVPLRFTSGTPDITIAPRKLRRCVIPGRASSILAVCGRRRAAAGRSTVAPARNGPQCPAQSPPLRPPAR